jgi:hypothetical protein
MRRMGARLSAAESGAALVRLRAALARACDCPACGAAREEAARRFAEELARPVKRCACGIVHSGAAWLALPFVGMQDGGPDFGPLELRNCRCGSTLALFAEARA